MEENKHEVITLLSSDEDSNSQDNLIGNFKIGAKSLKSTARKSTYNKMTGSNIAILKKENAPSVYSSSVVQENIENSIQAKPLESGVRDNCFSKNTTARKSFKNSLVSSLKDSSNSQTSTTDLQTKSSSTFHSSILPKLVGCDRKLPAELTITPLKPLSCPKSVMNTSETSRKNEYFVSTLTSNYNPGLLNKEKLESVLSSEKPITKNAPFANNTKLQSPDLLVTSSVCNISKSLPVTTFPKSLNVLSQNRKDKLKPNNAKSNYFSNKLFQSRAVNSNVFQPYSASGANSFTCEKEPRNSDFDKMVAKAPPMIMSKVPKISSKNVLKAGLIKNNFTDKKTPLCSQPLHNTPNEVEKTNCMLDAVSNSEDVIIMKVINKASSTSSCSKRKRMNDILQQKHTLEEPLHKKKVFETNKKMHVTSSKSDKPETDVTKSYPMGFPVDKDNWKHKTVLNSKLLVDCNNSKAVNKISNNLNSNRDTVDPCLSKFAKNLLTNVPVHSEDFSQKQANPAISLYEGSLENTGSQKIFNPGKVDIRTNKLGKVVQNILKRNVDLTFTERTLNTDGIEQPTLKGLNHLENSSNVSEGKKVLLKTVALPPENQLKLKTESVNAEKQIPKGCDSQKECISITNELPRIKSKNTDKLVVQKEQLLVTSSLDFVVQENKERIASLKKSLQEVISQSEPPKTDLDTIPAAIDPKTSDSPNCVSRTRIGTNEFISSKNAYSKEDCNSPFPPFECNSQTIVHVNETEQSPNATIISLPWKPLIAAIEMDNQVEKNCKQDSSSKLSGCSNDGQMEIKVDSVFKETLQASSKSSSPPPLDFSDKSSRKHKIVTSPKLSLKRKITNYMADSEKRIKNGSSVNTVAIPLPYPELTPSQLSFLPPQEKDPFPWSSSDDNSTKFKKLLEFSQSFMTESSEKERKQICKNMLKPLNRADPFFVTKLEFSHSLEQTFSKIKQNSNDIFIHLCDLKKQLDAHKQAYSNSVLQKQCLSFSSDQSESMKSFPQIDQEDIADELESSSPSFTFKPSCIVKGESAYESIENNVVETLKADDLCSEANKLEDNENIYKVFKGALASDLEASHKSNFGNEIGTSKLYKESDKTSLLDKTSKNVWMSYLNLETSNVAPSVKTEPSFQKKEPNYWDVPMSSKQADIILNLELKLSTISHTQESQFANKEKPSLANVLLPEETKKTHSVTGSLDSKQEKDNLIKEGVERRVSLLEKHLQQLDKKIKKLQAKELSLDDLDDEDSSYLLEDRYKKKFAKTWASLCKIKKQSNLVGLEWEKRFKYEGSRYGDINRAIEKLINKKKSREKFPNYGEVLNLIKKTNKEFDLGMGFLQEEKTARETFTDIGLELKSRRERDTEKDFGCYLTDNLKPEDDPAEHDEELRNKLSSSLVSGEKKIDEIIDKYAERQGNEPTNEESVDESDESSEEENETMNGNGDLPETDLATPSTEEHEEDLQATTPPTVPNSPEAENSNLVEIGSASDASTEPNSSQVNPSEIKLEEAVSLKHAEPLAKERRNSIFNKPVYISEEIEIVNNSDSSSCGLPSLADIVAL